MIYSISFHIEGVYGPGGYVHESLQEVVDFTKPLADLALDTLGDSVPTLEWFDTCGEEADPDVLLQSSNVEQVVDAISQISDFLKAKSIGYLDLSEDEHLFDLIDRHDIETWCSDSLRARIDKLRAEHASTISAIADEWSEG